MLSAARGMFAMGSIKYFRFIFALLILSVIVMTKLQLTAKSVKNQNLNIDNIYRFKTPPDTLVFDIPTHEYTPFDKNSSKSSKDQTRLSSIDMSQKVGLRQNVSSPPTTTKEVSQRQTNASLPLDTAALLRNQTAQDFLVKSPLQPTQKLVSFRKRFLLWDKVNPGLTSSIGRDLVLTDKYLIHRCDDSNYCGGWADRVKGTLMTYIIANLTGRIFKMEMLSPPCDISRYVAPNLVNWSLPTPFHQHIKGNLDARTIRLLDNNSLLYQIPETNFTTMLEETNATQYTYFMANFDYSEQLKRNKAYSHQLAWMAGLSTDQILSTLFTRLFKLSPQLQAKMDAFMERSLPTPNHRLICAQLRMGTNPTIPNDTERRFQEDKLAVVWKFIEQHSRTDEDRVFFMSDSENAVLLAKSQPFGYKLVETGGPIQHIDKSGRFNLTDRCDAMEKVIFDQHVLMQCDVLLVSHSGLSRMAAYVRGSDKDLYCLLKRGQIVPCKPSEIKRLYKLVGS